MTIASTSSSLPPFAADLRSARDLDMQARAQDKLRNDRSASQSLQQQVRNGSSGKDGKELAKQKVERLKAQLKMLQMMQPINPKALAQLARELKAAVQAYAAAGGAMADLGASGDVPATEPAAGSESASVPANAAQGADAAEAATQIQNVETVQTDSKDVQSDGEGQNKEAAPENDPYRRMVAQTQAFIQEQSRTSAEGKADQEFISEVRDLAERIKALAKKAKDSAPAERGNADEASNAADEAALAVESVGTALNTNIVSIAV